MKNKYAIQAIDLRHQVDLITPKKIQLFEEVINDAATVNARLIVILITHRQIGMISDGEKRIEIKIIKIIDFVYSLPFKQ